MNVCISPLPLTVNKGKVNEQRVTVPCGKCYYCKMKRVSDWRLRMEEEQKRSSSTLFVTLTYDSKSLPPDGVSVRELQLYFKRLRKRIDVLMGVDAPKIKYYAIGDYGELRQRPHYHFILFNFPVEIIDEIVNCWGKGLVDCQHVHGAAPTYVVGYILDKPSAPAGLNPVFSVSSTALGLNYIERMKKWHDNDIDKFYYPLPDGQKASLPRYYRAKLYSEDALVARAAYVKNQVETTVVDIQDLKLKYKLHEQKIESVRKMRTLKRLKKLKK